MYVIIMTSLCLDINECNRINDCRQWCVNTDGSYVCSCRIGYMLHSDGRSCEGLYRAQRYVYILKLKKIMFRFQAFFAKLEIYDLRYRVYVKMSCSIFKTCFSVSPQKRKQKK